MNTTLLHSVRTVIVKSIFLWTSGNFNLCMIFFVTKQNQII